MSRVLYLVVCAAPPAAEISNLVICVKAAGREVYVIPTPAAESWIDTAGLARITDHVVRSHYRRPGLDTQHPEPDEIVVAPATFNTINKWAAGISDNYALGVLNEGLGAGVPIVVSPYAKPTLTAHPAFAASLAILSASGVRFTEVNSLRPIPNTGPFSWTPVLEMLGSSLP